MSVGYYRNAPGHAVGCDSFWGWPCSCGAGHDPDACHLENCRRCWAAEGSPWRQPDRIALWPDGRASALYRCPNFERCDWYVDRELAECEECRSRRSPD